MITTIFSEDESAGRAILAINLAALCAHNHRRTSLADATRAKHAMNWSKRRSRFATGPQVTVRDMKSLGADLGDVSSALRTRYQDIVIDTDGVDSWHADAAMMATDVLVVPIRFYQGELKAPKDLASRIESLRFYNPRLRILIVDVLTLSACSDAEQMAFDVIKAFAGRIPTATISDVVIQERFDDMRNIEHGLTIFDTISPRMRAIAEIKDLYQEILRARETPLKAGEAGNAILHVIRRWTQNSADSRH